MIRPDLVHGMHPAMKRVFVKVKILQYAHYFLSVKLIHIWNPAFDKSKRRMRLFDYDQTAIRGLVTSTIFYPSAALDLQS